MAIKTNTQVVLRFNLKWGNGAPIDLRRHTGARCTLVMPDDTTAAITDLGYDRLTNQIWVRIAGTHNSQIGSYKANLAVMTQNLQMVTTGIVKVYDVAADGEDYKLVTLSLTVTSIDTPVNIGQGYSPKIVNGEWVVFDDSQQAYVPTGQSVVATEYVDEAVEAEAEARQQSVQSLESSLSSEVSRAQAKEQELQRAFSDGLERIVTYPDDTVPCDTFDEVEFATVERVNKVIQTDGSLNDSTSHYTWVYTISRDVKVWFDTSSLAALGNKTYVAVSATISGTTTSRMRFVNNGEDTLPNSENPLSLSEGDTLMIDCSLAESSVRGCKFTAEYSSDSGTLSPDIQVEAQQVKGLQQMYLKKTASQFDIYIKNKAGYVHYPLVHATKPYQGETTDAAFYDCWGIKQVSQCDTGLNEVETLFAKSEAEVASFVPNYAGNSMAVGGSVHGYENVIEEGGARKVIVLIDGSQVAEDAVIPLSPASCISITQQTELCPVGLNTNPFAHVTKTWEFRDGRMRLSATYTLLREIALNHVYIGMLGIYRRSEGQSDASYLTSRCQKRNHPLSVYNIEDGWWNESYRLELQTADKNCSAITLWGDEGISAEFSIIEPSPEETRGMFIQHNGGVYNKTYYRAVGLDPQVQEGTEYKATIQWTFF